MAALAGQMKGYSADRRQRKIWCQLYGISRGMSADVRAR
jgi:hypothetical protein